MKEQFYNLIGFVLLVVLITTYGGQIIETISKSFMDLFYYVPKRTFGGNLWKFWTYFSILFILIFIWLGLYKD